MDDGVSMRGFHICQCSAGCICNVLFFQYGVRSVRTMGYHDIHLVVGSLSVCVCLSLSLSLSVSVFLSVSISLCLSPCLCLQPSFFALVWMGVCLSLSVPGFLCLPVSVSIYFYLSLSAPFCVCLSSCLFCGRRYNFWVCPSVGLSQPAWPAISVFLSGCPVSGCFYIWFCCIFW